MSARSGGGPGFGRRGLSRQKQGLFVHMAHGPAATLLTLVLGLINGLSPWLLEK